MRLFENISREEAHKAQNEVEALLNLILCFFVASA